MAKKITKNKNITLNDLAGMVKHGFDDMDKSFEQVNKRFEQVDRRFEHLETVVTDGFRNVHERLEMIERDIQTFVSREEFEDLTARMRYIEKKLSILSGK